MSPLMAGLPTSGQPFASPHIYVDPAQELINRQAEHKMAVQSQIVPDKTMPLNEAGLVQPPMLPEKEDTKLVEAIKERDEAVRLRDLAQSPKDKQEASDLVAFWGERINELSGKPSSAVMEQKQMRTIEVPELTQRIQASASNRVKNPRNKRHKAEEKKSTNKVMWII